MTSEQIISELKVLSNPEAVQGMARFGINPDLTLGVSIPALRSMAGRVGKDHLLALELWDTGIHEARILAAFIDIPLQVTEAQMERWANDFDSWDVCDQVCSNLFDKTEYAYRKAIDWSGRDGEFVKRAGFTMMAALAVHDKKAPDDHFVRFLDIVKEKAGDNRNYVRKAVNWALRQIGKRNLHLNTMAIETAKEIRLADTKAGRWIAADALKELASDRVQERLR